jgi:hypothetical protein
VFVYQRQGKYRTKVSEKKMLRVFGHRQFNYRVKLVSCHNCMARPHVAAGGDSLQMWRVDANILNKQSRTADRRWSSSLGVWRGASNPPP